MKAHLQILGNVAYAYGKNDYFSSALPEGKGLIRLPELDLFQSFHLRGQRRWESCRIEVSRLENGTALNRLLHLSQQKLNLIDPFHHLSQVTFQLRTGSSHGLGSSKEHNG